MKQALSEIDRREEKCKLQSGCSNSISLKQYSTIKSWNAQEFVPRENGMS